MPPTTGSDTRMYAPRSESNLGYSKDEDYRHGIGDPKAMEEYRDKRQAEKEAETNSDDLPHLKIEVPKPTPEMPPMMPEEEEEEPMMDDQFNEGQQFGAMTGMPDMGNLSIGNATGTMPQPGGTLMTGEPMDDAWSTLMKGRLDNVKGAKDKSWKQPQYETQPGGADITTANTRRAKLQSRYVQPSKKVGLDRAPLSVHRSHLGIATKQPLRLFPQKYGQQMGSMARRKLMGNIPATPAGHAMGPETTYSPKTPKVASGAGLSLKEPRVPMMRGQAFAKAELKLIKQDLEELKKKQDYMHFTQIRRLLRQLKDAAERQESRLKASAGPGEVKESGHREGQDSTTRPEGATEDMENDPKNWGAPSTIFAARGSGRVG
tara:strand:+ start:10073 stop:11200 length:1128 start_codon:yes stop_codon:yes gene_type:complete